MKKITIFIIILGFSSLVSAATPTSILGSPYPPVPDSINSSPLIIHLVCHYIENLPHKPTNNEELLKEYIRAYTQLKKAVTSPEGLEDEHHSPASTHEKKSSEEHASPEHGNSSKH
ncbi:MAG: hypothetical protein ACMUJM_05710 [bacterium]